MNDTDQQGTPGTENEALCRAARLEKQMRDLIEKTIALSGRMNSGGEHATPRTTHSGGNP